MCKVVLSYDVSVFMFLTSLNFSVEWFTCQGPGLLNWLVHMGPKTCVYKDGFGKLIKTVPLRGCWYLGRVITLLGYLLRNPLTLKSIWQRNEKTRTLTYISGLYHISLIQSDLEIIKIDRESSSSFKPYSSSVDKIYFYLKDHFPIRTLRKPCPLQPVLKKGEWSGTFRDRSFSLFFSQVI